MRRIVTDYLVLEHQELAQLLNELAQELGMLPMARNIDEALERLGGLSHEISKALQDHLDEEEKILHPALEAHVRGIAGTLDRMRREHDAGETVEKAYLQSLELTAKSGRHRQEVMEAGRSYIQWVRGHLLEENGRLFPLVERGLDPETQKEVRRAMEELSQQTTARIAEASSHPAQA